MNLNYHLQSYFLIFQLIFGWKCSRLLHPLKIFIEREFLIIEEIVARQVSNIVMEKKVSSVNN